MKSQAARSTGLGSLASKADPAHRVSFLEATRAWKDISAGAKKGLGKPIPVLVGEGNDAAIYATSRKGQVVRSLMDATETYPWAADGGELRQAGVERSNEDVDAMTYPDAKGAFVPIFWHDYKRGVTWKARLGRQSIYSLLTLKYGPAEGDQVFQLVVEAFASQRREREKALKALLKYPETKRMAKALLNGWAPSPGDYAVNDNMEHNVGVVGKRVMIYDL